MSQTVEPEVTAPERAHGLRVLRVLRTRNVTPNLRRVTLGGDELAGFGSGPNLKILTPPPGETDPQWPTADENGRAVWPPADRCPAMRTYTVRRYDADAGELDVDFVLHGDEGPASAWAGRAVPGDVVGVLGPGGRVIGKAGSYLIAGDHTALPAISVILEELPDDARGHAFVEIPGPEDEQELTVPAGVTLTWLHRGDARPGTTTLLLDAVRAVPWPEDGDVYAWVSGESGAVRAIRSYVKDERGLDRRKFLVIGYWKKGLDEDGYHEKDNNDRDEDYYKTAYEEEEAAKR